MNGKEVRVVRCSNGHYYDGDQFEVCPHCGAPCCEVRKEEQRREQSADDHVTTVRFSAPPSESFDETERAGGSDGELPAAAELSGETGPVAGWLVGLNGSAYGKSYPLHYGINYIGRDADMDVCLSDTAVCQSRHGIIIYEPRKRQFIVQQGESKGLFYANEEVVLGNMAIRDRDILTVGNTKLMLAAFCNENFCWEDLEE